MVTSSSTMTPEMAAPSSWSDPSLVLQLSYPTPMMLGLATLQFPPIFWSRRQISVPNTNPWSRTVPRSIFIFHTKMTSFRSSWVWKHLPNGIIMSRIREGNKKMKCGSVVLTEEYLMNSKRRAWHLGLSRTSLSRKKNPRKKIRIHVTLSGDIFIAYKDNYGIPGDSTGWLLAKPDLPPFWEIERGQSGVGMERSHWDWIATGPETSLTAAKDAIENFLEGFQFEYKWGTVFVKPVMLKQFLKHD